MQNCRVYFTSTRLTRLPWFSAERADSNANGRDQPQCQSILLIHHVSVLLVQIVFNDVKYLNIIVYYVIRVSPFPETHRKRKKDHKGNERYGCPHDVADLWVYRMGIFSRWQ